MKNFYLLDTIQAIANASKDKLVDLTKVLNNDAYPGVVDKFMDAATGRGHRVVFGHDASYLPEIFEKFGMSGVYDYFAHLGKDVMSPDGIPIPFAAEFGNALGMDTMEKIDWLCLNIGDVTSGMLSIWHTKAMIDMLRAADGNITGAMVTRVTVGAGVKIVFSIVRPNPISLASGIVDIAVLTYYGRSYLSDCVGKVKEEIKDISDALLNSDYLDKVKERIRGTSHTLSKEFSELGDNIKARSSKFVEALEEYLAKGKKAVGVNASSSRVLVMSVPRKK